MKINLTLNTLLLWCAIALATFFCYKWLVISKDKTNADKALEEFIKARAQEYAVKKIALQKDSAMHVAKIDSAQRVYVALENKRKADNNFYQNKINALKTIRTYTARSNYADSLARTIPR